jgi:hypothetical protein
MEAVEASTLEPRYELPVLDPEFFRRSPWAAAQCARDGILTEGDPIQVQARRVWLGICQEAGMPYIPLYVERDPGCINAGYFEEATPMGLVNHRFMMVGLDLARCGQSEATLGLLEASLYHEAGHYAESRGPEAILRRRRYARQALTQGEVATQLHEGSGPVGVALGLASMLRHPVETVRTLGQKGVRAYGQFCMMREQHRMELDADRFVVDQRPDLAKDLGVVLGLGDDDLAHRVERISGAGNPLDRTRLRLGYLLVDSVSAFSEPHPPSLRRLQQLSRRAARYGVRADISQISQSLQHQSRSFEAVTAQSQPKTWLESMGY